MSRLNRGPLFVAGGLFIVGLIPWVIERIAGHSGVTHTTLLFSIMTGLAMALVIATLIEAWIEGKTDAAIEAGAGMTENYVIRLKRGTAEQWRRRNPVLHAGEPGFETDTAVFKIGDGKTPWNNLPIPNR